MKKKETKNYLNNEKLGNENYRLDHNIEKQTKIIEANIFYQKLKYR